MSYESPYREESPQDRRRRERIGRGTMLLLAILLMVVGLRGLVRTRAAQQAAATQPAVPQLVIGSRRPPMTTLPFAWAAFTGLTVVGAGLAVLSVLSARAMEWLLSPLNSAPVTGDRTPGLDDHYRGWNSPRYRASTFLGRLLHGWWWWQ